MDGKHNHFYNFVRVYLIESAGVKRKVAGMRDETGPASFAALTGRSTHDAQKRAASDLNDEATVHSIVEAALLIADAFRSGGKLLLCGNGGSAADCQHMAAEFVSLLNKDFKRPGLPAIALTTDTSFLTAFANDENFEGVFARQVETLGKSGDVLIAISTSGSSPNVVKAVASARVCGMRTIALTAKERPLLKMTDVGIGVPAHRVSYIQEAHLAIEHIICDLVERMLFSKEKSLSIS